MASIYDLYIEQGSDFKQSLNLSGDFTGYTISGTFRDSFGEVTLGYVTWTDDTLGELDIELTSAETSTMGQGVGYYNIEVELSGVVVRILQGRVYVDGEVK